MANNSEQYGFPRITGVEGIAGFLRCQHLGASEQWAQSICNVMQKYSFEGVSSLLRANVSQPDYREILRTNPGLSGPNTQFERINYVASTH